MTDSPTRHALLIGCPVDGLRGVEQSVADMRALLDELGFACEELVGARAERASIVASIEALIDRCRRDHAVVLYYAGHGGVFFPRREPAPDRQERERTHGVMITSDMMSSDAEHFLGLLGSELGILVRALEGRTKNVTAILDCCHADTLVPRFDAGEARAAAAYSPKVALDLALALTEHKTRGSHDGGRTVRVLASTSGVEAYLDLDAEPGVERLLFTTRLVTTLREHALPNAWTWDQVIRRVRGEVLRTNDAQRPALSGPRYRLPFTTEARPEPSDTFHVEHDGERLRIAGGAARGLARGEVFELRAYSGKGSLGRAWVDRLAGLDAILECDTLDRTPRWCWGRRLGHASPVRVAVEDEDERALALGQALRERGYACVAPGEPADVRVRAAGARMSVRFQDGDDLREIAVARDVLDVVAVLERCEHWQAVGRWSAEQPRTLSSRYRLRWSADGGPWEQAPPARVRRELAIELENLAPAPGTLYVRILRGSAALELVPWDGTGTGWSVAEGKKEVRRYRVPPGARGPEVTLLAIGDGPFEVDGLVTPPNTKSVHRGDEGALGKARRIDVCLARFVVGP